MLTESKNKKIIGIAVIVFTLLGAGIFYYNSRIKINETLIGIGTEATIGKTAVFDYRAFLYDSRAPKGLGVEFDSSYRRHIPMRALLGAQQVIPGLDKALIGMKAGGQREVVIPASQAYGDKGAGDGLVPPGTKVVYLIELRSLE